MQVFHDSPVHQVHSRVLNLFLFLSLLYVILALRFTYLQAIPHGKSLEDRDLKMLRLPARRGDILDRNGVPLAVTVDGYDIWVRPNLIRSKNNGAEVKTALAQAMRLPEAEIQSKLDLAQPFAFIQRNVTHSVGQAVLDRGLLGVGADPVYLRVYPKGSLAAQILGRVNTDNSGTAGLEMGYNAELKGSDGLTQYRVDGKNDEIPGTEKLVRTVRNGEDLRLTLDARIQAMAEEKLSDMVQQHHAAGGCTVVIDVPTGAILAIANRPTFDPNMPVKDMGALLNRAISFAYEPGSTMKMITASAALSEGTWNTTQTVTCNGGLMIGNRRIRCVIEPPYHGGHGTETIRDILRNSCNVGAATVGMRLGGDKLFDYISRFGMLDRPKLGLPGAVAYRLPGPDTWARMRLANISFGQGIMVTPLQILYAYGAVANGGKLMKPELIGSVVDPDTGQVRRIQPEAVRQVVTPETASLVTQLLEAVVYDGTGKPSQIPGYTVAGKTGSAQMAGGHGYISGKFIASFIGFAPASHPRVACITMIDEPEGIHWGAVLGAPVVREMLRWSLQYLQVPPDAPQLQGDGADTKTLREEEHSGIPLPGSSIHAAAATRRKRPAPEKTPELPMISPDGLPAAGGQPPAKMGAHDGRATV